MTVHFGMRITEPLKLDNARLLTQMMLKGASIDKQAPVYKVYSPAGLAQDVDSFIGNASKQPAGTYRAYVLVEPFQLTQKQASRVLESRPLAAFVFGDQHSSQFVCALSVESTGRVNGSRCSDSGAWEKGSPEWINVNILSDNLFKTSNAGETAHVYSPRLPSVFVEDTDNFLSFLKTANPGFHTAYFVFEKAPKELRQSLPKLVKSKTFDIELREQGDVAVLRVLAEVEGQGAVEPATISDPVWATVLNLKLKSLGEDDT